MRLLLLCQANIARSACAEVLARSMSDDPGAWIVTSAGVQALSGHPIDPVMAAALERRGLDASTHRARQAAPHLLKAADLVLTFESSQRAWVLAQQPAAVRSTFTIRRAAQLLADRPRHGEPLGFMAHDSTAYGPDDDFADPFGRGPSAAERAVEEIESLLEVVLPALGAAAPVQQRQRPEVMAP